MSFNENKTLTSLNFPTLTRALIPIIFSYIHYDTLLEANPNQALEHKSLLENEYKKRIRMHFPMHYPIKNSPYKSISDAFKTLHAQSYIKNKDALTGLDQQQIQLHISIKEYLPTTIPAAKEADSCTLSNIHFLPQDLITRDSQSTPLLFHALQRPAILNTLYNRVLQHYDTQKSYGYGSDESESDEGMTVPHSAVKFENRPSYKTEGMSLIHWAATLNLPDKIRELTDKGTGAIIEKKSHRAYPFFARDNQSQSPLHLAAEYGCLKSAKALIETAPPKHRKKFINLQDMFLRTALFVAAKNNQLPAVILLLKAGADHTIRNMNDKTPLEEAEKWNIKDVIPALKNPRQFDEKPQLTGAKRKLTSENVSEPSTSLYQFGM